MITAHPLADIFPMLDDVASASLMDDIAENGLSEKIVVFEGRVLDGRNRYRALCEIHRLGGLVGGERISPHDLELEQSPYIQPFRGADPLAFVLSRNLHRRHLTESQRAMVASRVATLSQGRPASGNEASLPVFRQHEAAEALRVSERSVRAARAVQDHGAPETIAAVDRGDLAVSVAADLARLPPDEQARLIREAADPRALSKVAKELRADRQAEKRDRREAREAELGDKLAALPERRYGVIIADPEWQYEVWSEATGRDRSPDNHYPTSSLDAIKARPVSQIAADDCVLFLWVTTPFLPAGLDVLSAWGFSYVSSLVWHKLRPGRARGTGYWFLGAHETVLVGKRGSPPAPTPGTQVDSLFAAPIGAHSEKPTTVHEIAERYFPTLPKIELNARARRDGWDVWGLEAPAEPAKPAITEESARADLDAYRFGERVLTPRELVIRIAYRFGAAAPVPVEEAFGDAWSSSPECLWFRRHVALIASREFGISQARLADALGVRRQTVAEQIARAAREGN